MNFAATPIFYTARFQAQGLGRAAPIHSEYRSQSIEINDAIRWQNWTFNAGVLLSRDRRYGSGLREDAGALSGFVSAPGNKYLMYEIPFKDRSAARRRDVSTTAATRSTGVTRSTTRRPARCLARRHGTAT